jgi:hypothetical protein
MFCMCVFMLHTTIVSQEVLLFALSHIHISIPSPTRAREKRGESEMENSRGYLCLG